MRRSRLLIATGYGLAMLLIVLPLLQAATSLLPLQPSHLRWRIEAFGLVSHALLLPAVGTAVATGTAVLLHHRVLVRVLATLWALAALAVAAAAVVFALDLVQYQGAVGIELRGHYTAAGLTYLTAALLHTLFLFWLAVAGWRAGRRSQPAQRRRKRRRRLPAQPDELSSQSPSADEHSAP